MRDEKILLSIDKKRMLEIDKILKKTESDILAGNVKTMSLEEFDDNIEKMKESVVNGGEK